ncbi:MAG: SDR family NAD(P)-dependent oxidoreductase [Acidimicrobiales bacterium]
MQLRGTHVVVTGASRGIGEAIADELARRGAVLTVVARTAAALAPIAGRTGATVVPADLGTASGRDGLIARIEQAAGRPVEVLVNNAGIEVTKPLVDHSENDLTAIVEVNLHAPMELTRQVLPGMLARGAGHVVNVSSMASAGGFPGMSSYCATKAGLSQFTRVLRQDLKGTKVALTGVEIGPIPTDMLAGVDAYPPVKAAFDRFERLQLMPQVPREVVARETADAIERNRRYVWLPKRAGLFPLLTSLPQRIVDPLIRDLR